MNHALRLGRRSRGMTGSNPAVGCVIVAERQGRQCLVGAGCTAPGGRPHAERVALDMAGNRARGATAYVTLEPCSHYGQTPPCTGALIDAGVCRVVTAMNDPDVRVAGTGHRRLREAGVQVTTGFSQDEAGRDLAGFLSRVVRGRPHVVLKLAMSADGKISAKPGEPTSITGPAARAQVHVMRAQADAILVGVSTVMADDPALTCRLPGMVSRSPIRLVTDSRLTIPADAQLLQTAGDVPVWILTCASPEHARVADLKSTGATIVHCGATLNGKVDLHDAMQRLGGRGVNRVLAEGGAHMAKALVEEDLVDELALFTAPGDIGEGGLAAFAGIPVSTITSSPKFRARRHAFVGEDKLAVYERVEKDTVMFTGLVTDIGEVLSVEQGGDVTAEIACNYDVDTLAIGASIACSGVCLTVVSSRQLEDGRGAFTVQYSAETLSKTTLSCWKAGTRVNLEKSLKLGDEIGGHLVSGHADGVARILSVQPEGDSLRFSFEVDAALARFIAPKGSVALDGTSLTVNEVDGNQFGVNIIPHTAAVTTWGRLGAGDSVNVEIDMLARYVARLAQFQV